MVNFKILETGHHADNVNDGVHGPDLVEMNLIDRGPVDRRLGLGQTGEDCQGLVPDLSRNCSLAEQAADLRQMAVLMVSDDREASIPP